MTMRSARLEHEAHAASDEFFRNPVEWEASTHVSICYGTSTKLAGQICDRVHLAGAVELDGLLVAAVPTAAAVTTWTA